MLKKILFSNFLQNCCIIAISVYYCLNPIVVGFDKILIILLMYGCFSFSIILEFIFHKWFSLPKKIIYINLILIFPIFIFIFGGFSIFDFTLFPYITVLVVCLNFFRFIYLSIMVTKSSINKSGPDLSLQVEATVHKENLIITIYAFLLLVIRGKSIILFLINFLVVISYFYINKKKINELYITFLCVIVLIILNFFGISGLLNYSFFGIIMMITFRKTKA